MSETYFTADRYRREAQDLRDTASTDEPDNRNILALLLDHAADKDAALIAFRQWY